MISNYLECVSKISKILSSEPNIEAIEKMVSILNFAQKYNGRIFFIGVGGSAANASHAANDFRKLCNIESYCVTDNIYELTARVNDDGWDTAFVGWLKNNHLCSSDVLFVLSVGGGDLERNVSVNIIEAINYVKGTGANVAGIIGNQRGYLAKPGIADCVIIIPTIDPELITVMTENFQSVLLHLLVSYLKKNKTVW